MDIRFENFVIFELMKCDCNNEVIIKYYILINKVEIVICDGDFDRVLKNYLLVFREIKKFFGFDVYNVVFLN